MERELKSGTGRLGSGGVSISPRSSWALVLQAGDSTGMAREGFSRG